MNDGIKWWPTVTVTKYDADKTAAIEALLGHTPSLAELQELDRMGMFAPDDVLVSEGNILVNNGVSRITSIITGGGGGMLTNTLGFLGVGNDSTASAATAAQTALQGSSQLYRPLEAGFPSLTTTTKTNDTINVSALFSSGVAEFVWGEWCIGSVASGTVSQSSTLAGTGTSPIMWNRKQDTLGTKGAGSTWTLAAKIVLS